MEISSWLTCSEVLTAGQENERAVPGVEDSFPGTEYGDAPAGAMPELPFSSFTSRKPVLLSLSRSAILRVN